MVVENEDVTLFTTGASVEKEKKKKGNAVNPLPNAFHAHNQATHLTEFIYLAQGGSCSSSPGSN